MRIAAVQTNPQPSFDDNVATITRFTEQAAAGGAKLVVFPEEAMMLAADEIKPQMRDIVAKDWPRFEKLIAELAVANQVTIIAAGYEPHPEGRAPYNTIIAVDPTGAEIARYHKMHLYDAFAYKESDYVTHGTELPPIIEVEGLRIGIANCYDLRFPELFRSMTDRGVDAISLSAAWVAGKGKEAQWTVLSQARALENVAWFIAVGTVSDDTVGLSTVYDPLGMPVAGLNGHDEGVVFADIDRERVERARAMLPAIANRRIDTVFTVKES